MRQAYLRDGRAMVRWMSWLEGKILKEKREVGEWAAAMALGRFRRDEEYFA
jgi:Xaa-Pro aminopeptidase